MKKYLVSIRIATEYKGFSHAQRSFEAENPAAAIVKANAYIKEHKWEGAQVTALYEKLWDINPQA